MKCKGPMTNKLKTISTEWVRVRVEDACEEVRRVQDERRSESVGDILEERCVLVVTNIIVFFK